MCEIREFVDELDGQPAVRGFLHTAEKSRGGLVLTHGAGANCQAPLLRKLADVFCERGITVLRCDLPFRQQRPHGPPLRTAELDQQGLRRAVEVLRNRLSGRVFLGGHSYGGRQATMLASPNPEVAAGLLLLSYPLHPPKRREQMRTAHFAALRTPSLFVHGTRDGFGSIEEMTEALKLIPAKKELVPIDGAGHELLSKRNEEELPHKIVEAFCDFFEVD